MAERKDRSKYTFFPHNDEERMISEAGTDDLLEMIDGQSNMIGRFVHELWRTGRDETLHTIAQERLKNNRNLFETMLEDMGNSLPVLYYFDNMPVDEGETFVRESLVVMAKGIKGQELDQPLNTVEESAIKKAADLVTGLALYSLAQFKARLN